MRTRDSLTGRVAATLEHPLHLATDAVTDLAHKGGEVIADLGQRTDAAGDAGGERVRAGRRFAARGGRAARKEAGKRAEAARKEARTRMAAARKEAGRKRKRFFKRRRHAQALVGERVDDLKAGAAAAGTAATAAATSRASDVVDAAASLAGDAKSWLAEQAAGIDVGGAVAALAPTALSKTTRKRRRPLTTIVIGAAAGLVGMAAMDAAQRGVALASPPADDGEGSGEEISDPWQDAPSPAKIGRRVWEGVLRQPRLGPDKIGFATNVVHVGYGITLAAVFALIEESREHPRPLLDGALFGVAAWAFEEYLLPRVDISPPASSLSATEHAQDLAFHLAFGLGVGATIAAADTRR